MTDTRATLLLDVDGTLVDSTYLHVLCWSQALAEAGHPVAGARIQRQIGKGSDLLLAALLGDSLAEEIGDQVTDRRSGLYLDRREHLRRLPGAQELIHSCVDRGLTVALATSSSPAERDVMLEVLDLGLELTVTDSSDVETAKPAPDIVEVAMNKVDADKATTVLVGDAVWDIESGHRAGIPVIGVTSGGLAASELRDAGAAATYDDPAGLLAALDDSPVGEILRRG